MTSWKRGPAEEFWAEDNTPSGAYDNYVHDVYELPHSEVRDVLRLLNALGVLDYGTIYEAIDCIRIKVR